MSAKTVEKPRGTRRATTVEARESQMVALAELLAEKKLRDGTAGPQIICHYLKLGSTKEKLEKEMLEKKIELAKAQAEAIQSSARSEEMFKDAINAFKSYNGAFQSQVGEEDVEY